MFDDMNKRLLNDHPSFPPPISGDASNVFKALKTGRSSLELIKVVIDEPTVSDGSIALVAKLRIQSSRTSALSTKRSVEICILKANRTVR